MAESRRSTRCRDAFLVAAALALAISTAWPAPAWAQPEAVPPEEEPAVVFDLDDGMAAADGAPDEEFWDRKTIANTIAIGGGVGFMAWAFGAWWADGANGFGVDSESFFGQDTYSGGADKLGHMWGGYATARAVTSLYDWAGYEKTTSVLIGSGYSFGILFVAELADGFTDFRFSWEDLIFNAAGAGFGALLELSQPLDDLLDYRIEYKPSSAFEDSGESLNFAEDYSGMKFLLSVRGAGIPWVRDTPLRFFDADVGYYTLYYRPKDETRIPERHFITGFSLDLAQIFDELVFPWIDGYDTPKHVVSTIFRYYQVPYTRISAVDEHLN